MAVSYKKLWHILVDRNMKKKDLEEAAGITHYQMYKLRRDLSRYVFCEKRLNYRRLAIWL